jgi:hypothetical protein
MRTKDVCYSRRLGIILWIVAFVVMVGFSIYQRHTGPTWPKKGSVVLDGQRVEWSLVRSGTSGTDALVSLELPAEDGALSGTLLWRRYPVAEPFSSVAMDHVPARNGQPARLEGKLPFQLPAGKLEYWILVQGPGGQQAIPPDETVVMRYKGEVPAAALIPHILLMFLAVTFGIRTLFEAVFGRLGLRWMSIVTLELMVIGGLIAGPIVQRYAFGALWTGVPFGWDLTDNKTLVMTLVWAAAVVCNGAWAQARRLARPATILGALVMIVVYLVPHSMRGSQLDYVQLETGASPGQAVRVGGAGR